MMRVFDYVHVTRRRRRPKGGLFTCVKSRFDRQAANALLSNIKLRQKRQDGATTITK